VDSHRYECVRCRSGYPVVLGIPDFRLFPDPWIGFEDDRQKARRLVERSRGASLDAMVHAYWAMTPATSAAQAARFVHHAITAYDRSREWLDRLDAQPAPAGTWLDVGTGTGDLACAAAARGVCVIGVDIAMRWLVVAQRRAQLAGLDVDLVCCNAEHLPFADGAFARVASVGTLEHCVNERPVLAEARRVLARNGDVRLRTVNRFSLMPEPHVGVWGVGFLPRGTADRYVRWRSGSGYAHHRPVSSRELHRGLARAGFRSVRVEAAPLLETERERLGRLRWVASAYEGSRRLPVGRTALRWLAPILEASGVAA
jgi:2-polyprenyl-3-methyl-5-hydroxy-6-metoxy-1,4-benzoquinol methylase